MKLNSFISSKRLFLLVKRDILSKKLALLVVFGAIFAGVYLSSLVNIYSSSPSRTLYFSLFANIIFISGFIITSILFKELHKKETAQNYLLIPASTFEKFLSRLLLSTIGFALLVLAGLTLMSYTVEGINTLIFGRHSIPFYPFSGDVFKVIAHYFVAQSIFFLGAIYFRRYNFIKTINSIFIFLFALAILGVIFTRIVYHDIFSGFLKSDNFYFQFHLNSLPIDSDRTRMLVRTAEILYWIIPAPLFWTISYFRLKETEVKNAL